MTWIEAILVVTLVAACVAATEIARKLTEVAREDSKPVAAAFDAREGIEEHERVLARLRDEQSRAEGRLIDARIDVLRRDAEIASGAGEAKQAVTARRTFSGVAAYVAQVGSAVQRQEAEVAKRRKSASRSFRAATDAFEWNTRVIAAGWAIGAVAFLSTLSWIFVSLTLVRNAFDVHRGVVFGVAGVMMGVVGLFELGGAPVVVVVAALALLAAVLAVAARIPARERRS